MSTIHNKEVIPVEIMENPLLKRKNRMPGETIRLPSRGKFYDEIVLKDHKNGEITLRPITLTDEIMMKSPDMLIQGTAIDHTFRRCSPNIVSPLDLVMPDVNYILTQLRRISLGSELDLNYVCQHCQHRQEVTIPLEYFTQASRELEDAELEEHYKYVTEYDGATVELRPVPLRDFLDMQNFSIEMLRNPDEYAEYIRRSFMGLIKSVDGVTQREFINEWLDELPIKDIKAITKKMSSVLS